MTSRPWYRVLGYRSAASLLLLFGVLVLLLVQKYQAHELDSAAGLLIAGITVAVAAVAVWDFMDWRREREAARASLTRARHE